MNETKLLERVCYALNMGWKHRKTLGCYLHDAKLQIKKVNDLSIEHLQEIQVEVLVLDFDGVLGADHAWVPADFIKPWLDQVYQHYQDKLFILSNKPLSAREVYLQTHYPKLGFIKGVAKKPYPEGLLLIKQKTQVRGEHILFCDDRLLTGILAAELAGVKALWVTKPIKNFMTRFWQEIFFMILRLIDRVFLWMFG